MAKTKADGKLAGTVESFGDGETLSAFQIGAAYKAALADFVLGKTNRKAIAEVSRLLAGALAARRQELMERDELSSSRLHNFYAMN